MESYLEVDITGNGFDGETVRFDDGTPQLENIFSRYGITFRYYNSAGYSDLIRLTFPLDVKVGDVYTTGSYDTSDYDWKVAYTSQYAEASSYSYAVSTAYDFTFTVTEWGSVARGELSGTISGSNGTVVLSNGTFQFPVQD
ncbi:MAG TPA: hypothetical protein PK926_17550 [Spirochaetota bacterium]|mgnify:CR=1 FL=1|nr:hypothetical protein [Spirochaetota bacterium]HPI91128.1 hypothetical protein [Spirochaetota bacterium]HPR49980.1 hypothetical protein [Spirochaetota bacterium]